MTPAESPVQQASGDGSGGQPPGREKWWNSTTKVVVAITGLLVALAGLLGALQQAGLIGGSTTTPTTSDTSTVQNSVPVNPLFRGFILRRPSIEVRTEPTLSGRVVGYLSYDTEVYVVCTALGDPVEGPGPAGQPNVITALWDKVRTEPNGHDVGFIPDAWVKTGTTAPQAAGC